MVTLVQKVRKAEMEEMDLKEETAMTVQQD